MKNEETFLMPFQYGYGEIEPEAKGILTQFNKKPFKTFIRNYAEQVVLFMKYHVPICKITSNNIDKSCINSLKKLHSKSIT